MDKLTQEEREFLTEYRELCLMYGSEQIDNDLFTVKVKAAAYGLAMKLLAKDKEP